MYWVVISLKWANTHKALRTVLPFDKHSMVSVALGQGYQEDPGSITKDDL